ncbi:MAG: hypothetical protein P1U63_10925 [Coxiellaceae bacterium]|nr:hypothetical protein [Coxiellaceae bacterium]
MKIRYTATIMVGGAIAATSCWATTNYFTSTSTARQQYVSANEAQSTPAAAKKNWQKPRVHGRGNGDLALIVMNGKPSPKGAPSKGFPGMDWKAKPKTAPKQFPGMDWKSKPTQKRPPRGTRALPGMTWKPKNRPAGAS